MWRNNKIHPSIILKYPPLSLLPLSLHEIFMRKWRSDKLSSKEMKNVVVDVRVERSFFFFPKVMMHYSKLTKLSSIYFHPKSLMYMGRLMTKPTKCPAKTQISLGIRPVWSESSLCAQWVAKDPSFLHADSEDSDQIGRMRWLIWLFAGRTFILLVLSRGGSYIVWLLPRL